MHDIVHVGVCMHYIVHVGVCMHDIVHVGVCMHDIVHVGVCMHDIVHMGVCMHDIVHVGALHGMCMVGVLNSCKDYTYGTQCNSGQSSKPVLWHGPTSYKS